MLAVVRFGGRGPHDQRLKFLDPHSDLQVNFFVLYDSRCIWSHSIMLLEVVISTEVPWDNDILYHGFCGFE